MMYLIVTECAIMLKSLEVYVLIQPIRLYDLSHEESIARVFSSKV